MNTGTAVSYRVFVRNWWRWESKPGQYTLYGSRLSRPVRQLVPDPSARKTTLATRCTEEDARAICQRYNSTHKPGPLSRKAEYERE